MKISYANKNILNLNPSSKTEIIISVFCNTIEEYDTLIPSLDYESLIHFKEEFSKMKSFMINNAIKVSDPFKNIINSYCTIIDEDIYKIDHHLTIGE